jgi:uncharacterized membrane protein
MSNFNDGSRLVDELKAELVLIRRDLVERLRRIEEYITFLESDISRLRLDLQRMNDRLQEMVMEKKTELAPKPTTTFDFLGLSKTEGTFIKTEKPLMPEKVSQPSTIAQPGQIQTTGEKREGLNQTEIAIIKYLIENPGTKSATPIAQSIGKAREHVARTLKKLAEEKKIIRDETTWPYTYIVPDETKKLVMAEEKQPL